MEKPFHELREQLLRAGIAPRHVRHYIRELREHWADLVAEEARSGKHRADAEVAAFARLGTRDELAKSMIEHRQFHSWSARAPWLMFSLGPLVILGAAYLAVCCYLWLGWRVFMPGADTPFGGVYSGPIYGLRNIYFQAGKYFYFWAPMMGGWLIAATAARQRMKAAWVGLSLAIIAWMGGTAEIHAGRTAVPGGLGHVSMSFCTIHGSIEGSMYGFLLIFCVSALPYLLWRVRRAFLQPA